MAVVVIQAAGSGWLGREGQGRTQVVKVGREGKAQEGSHNKTSALLSVTKPVLKL